MFKIKSKIIAASEARSLSEANKSVGINYIMERVEEYAAQGKKKFEIRDKQLLRQWKDELVGLGYILRTPEDGVWVLSWDTNDVVQDKFEPIKEVFDTLGNIPDMAQVATMCENAIDFAGKKLKVVPTGMDVVDYSYSEYELSSVGLYLIVDKKMWHYHLRGYAEKYFFIRKTIFFPNR